MYQMSVILRHSLFIHVDHVEWETNNPRVKFGVCVNRRERLDLQQEGSSTQRTTHEQRHSAYSMHACIMLIVTHT